VGRRTLFVNVSVTCASFWVVMMFFAPASTSLAVKPVSSTTRSIVKEPPLMPSLSG
jgi:hypothetical protein